MHEVCRTMLADAKGATAIAGHPICDFRPSTAVRAVEGLNHRSRSWNRSPVPQAGALATPRTPHAGRPAWDPVRGDPAERAARAAYMQYVHRLPWPLRPCERRTDAWRLGTRGTAGHRQRREQRSQRIRSRDVVLFQNHARRFGGGTSPEDLVASERRRSVSRGRRQR